MRARNLVARFRGLCDVRAFDQMQSLVDPLRILVDSRDALVIDLRTGYRISFERIRALRDTCRQVAVSRDDGILVITFSEHTGYREVRIVFVVSRDCKIRAIMDEATWKSQGTEIVAQVREELEQASQGRCQEPPADRGSQPQNSVKEASEQLSRAAPPVSLCL